MASEKLFLHTMMVAEETARTGCGMLQALLDLMATLNASIVRAKAELPEMLADAALERIQSKILLVTVIPGLRPIVPYPVPFDILLEFSGGLAKLEAGRRSNTDMTGAEASGVLLESAAQVRKTVAEGHGVLPELDFPGIERYFTAHLDRAALLWRSAAVLEVTPETLPASEIESLRSEARVRAAALSDETSTAPEDRLQMIMDNTPPEVFDRLHEETARAAMKAPQYRARALVAFPDGISRDELAELVKPGSRWPRWVPRFLRIRLW